jgi:hypothetical protein
VFSAFVVFDRYLFICSTTYLFHDSSVPRRVRYHTIGCIVNFGISLAFGHVLSNQRISSWHSRFGMMIGQIGVLSVFRGILMIQGFQNYLVS